jgi:hypothetical protein
MPQPGIVHEQQLARRRPNGAQQRQEQPLLGACSSMGSMPAASNTPWALLDMHAAHPWGTNCRPSRLVCSSNGRGGEGQSGVEWGELPHSCSCGSRRGSAQTAAAPGLGWAGVGTGAQCEPLTVKHQIVCGCQDRQHAAYQVVGHAAGVQYGTKLQHGSQRTAAAVGRGEMGH